MPVQVLLAKWGDGLGLRLPPDVAARLGLAEGVSVVVEASDDGRLIVSRSRQRFTLDELLAEMTPEREHPLEDDRPVGTEIL